MGRAALIRVTTLLAIAVTASTFSHFSTNELQQNVLGLHRNSTVLDTSLLHSQLEFASRQLLYDGAIWAKYQQQGRYAIIKNPSMPDQHSSTGQVAIHAVLLPESYKILIFGRNIPKSGPKSQPEPHVYGNVSTVYDAKAGTYIVTPNAETLFCAGHTITSDGNVVATGGDMGYGYNFMKEGRDVVRIFHRESLKWETLPGVKLSEYRWYPTQVS
eukprot:GHRR01021311.1.p1 GENE.GHRR01021311.1~~GHRR01021311.1.p1  ORF type:complete len:215 (+),score=33.30 GHRR01021311.1:423-1067(+)